MNQGEMDGVEVSGIDGDKEIIDDYGSSSNAPCPRSSYPWGLTVSRAWILATRWTKRVLYILPNG